MNVWAPGLRSIFARSVVTQRSTLRGVTNTEWPHTALRMSSRVNAHPRRVAMYDSSLNSFAVNSTANGRTDGGSDSILWPNDTPNSRATSFRTAGYQAAADELIH